MRKPLIAGNWKMHGSSASVAVLSQGLANGAGKLQSVEIAACPPAIFLPLVAKILSGSGVVLGAQNVCDHDEGAFTGEISGSMLREFGCHYAIVGHSERRHIYGESDQLIARRFSAALRFGLCPILCVGETLEEREADRTEVVLARQIDAIISEAGTEAWVGAVIAYEPVWAIGTGRTATPDQAQAAHQFIRQRVVETHPAAGKTLRILYGGSIKPDNAAILFSMKDVDGGLIGGASLDAASFLAICSAGSC